MFSILLPSLKSAREKARTVVCAAHTSGIAKASTTYHTDGTGWLVGSPGTSGSVMYREDEYDGVEEDISTDASQNWDYAGALAPTHLNTSLPQNRAERMARVKEGIFACPSNPYFANPFGGEVGNFKRQPMTSYNTVRNFLLWPRTVVDFDASQPWGPIAPVPEASFDTIGGGTLTPKNYAPHIDRIRNAAGKVQLADGNRFTDQHENITYQVDWNAEAGGAFSNGGPTLPEWNPTTGHLVLSSYHFDRQRGKYGYRHRSSGDRGIVVNYFDGHSRFMTEAESREPDPWWPKGTVIPFEDFNDVSLKIVFPRLDARYNYVVGR